MTITANKFDIPKALEAILFVASKVEGPTLHKISKMFYFADKLHLERYGSPITADTYHAMKNGPVPSHIYDMMKFARGDKNIPEQFRLKTITEALKVISYKVSPKRNADIDYLSESEIECLLDATEEHGMKEFDQLSDETHDKAWGSVSRNSAIPLDAIIDTLPNKDDIKAHIYA